MVLYIVDMGFLLAARLFNLPVSERVVFRSARCKYGFGISPARIRLGC